MRRFHSKWGVEGLIECLDGIGIHECMNFVFESKKEKK